MAGDIRYVIMQSGTNPPQYFRTKQLNRLRRRQGFSKIEIHGATGIWSGSMRMARRYLHNTRKLPEGCEFLTVDAGSTKNGCARARKRGEKIPF